MWRSSSSSSFGGTAASGGAGSFAVAPWGCSPAVSSNTTINKPRGAAGSASGLTVRLMVVEPPLDLTFTPLAVNGVFRVAALWMATPSSSRSPSRAIAKTLLLTFPEAGSRYFPMRPLT